MRLLGLLIALLLITGCAKQPQDNAVTTTASEATTAQVTGSSATASEPTAPLPTESTGEPAPSETSPSSEAAQGLLYHSESLGFSLTFPESWRGRYVLIEREDSVEVFERQNYDFGGIGLLFLVRMVPRDEYRENMFPAYRVLAQSEDTVAVWIEPSDVPFDLSLRSPYEALSGDLSSVRESFRWAVAR